MPDRPPIDIDAVVTQFEGGEDYPRLRLEVVASTGSTNADLLAAAADGAPEWTVLVADLQTAGRGRRAERTWLSPPRAGLTFSLIRRPREHWPLTWIPLMAGTAVCEALTELGVDGVGLKWPNDVRLDGRKLGGILCQATREAVVIGIGLNITTTRDELPGDTATSLAVARPDLGLDRQQVLIAALRNLEWQDWDPVITALARADYLPWCETLGQDVVVSPVNGAAYRACAVDIDEHGALVLDGPRGRHAISAGEIETLRPEPTER